MRFLFHPFELDEPSLELRRDGEPVAIGGQALSLLLHLVRNRERVVTREELHDLLWKGAAIGETSLGQAVRQTRQALSEDAGVQHFIRNVRGRGYRFGAPVEVVDAGEAETSASVAHPAAVKPPADTFLGREAELALFENLVESSRGGRGDAVWIRGEEGIGKTRLLGEIAERAHARGARVLHASCIHNVLAAPYAPFAEFVAATRNATGTEAAWRALGAEAEDLARLAGESGLVNGDAPPPPPREEERRGLFEATARLFDALARGGPLVLFLDDLHWADPATLALTHFVARRAAAGGWILVGAVRAGASDELRTTRLGSVLQLGERRAPLTLTGLGVEQTGRLLEALAGRALPRDLVDDIQRETGGNPFFAREIFRHLLDEGVLVDDEGEWSESLRLDEVALPDGVRHVLSRRLAGLGPAGRELLSAASAAGGTFHFEVARRAAQLDESAALDGLDEALESHLVEATGDAEVYAFCHDLTRRVLYTEQSPARRVRLHRRIAEALVAAFGPRAAVQAERIARQFHASRDLPGAEAGVPQCLLAADRAAALSAWEDEATYVQMALDLILADDKRRALLLERLGLALAFTGDTAEAARVASQAATWIEAHQGRAAASEYLVNVVTGMAWGSSELAWSLTEEAEKLIDRDDPLVWARLRLVRLWRETAVGQAPFDAPEQRAATLAALDNWEAIDSARKNGLSLVGLAFESRREVLERAGDTAVFLALWAGEYERAIALFRADVRAADTHAEIAASYFYVSAIARLEAALGRLDRARVALAEADGLLARLPGGQQFAVVAASMRTEIAHAEGEGFEALIPLFEDLALNVDAASQWLMPTVLCVGAEVLALAGREEDALRMLEAGLPGMVRSPGWMTSFTLMVNAAVGALWALRRDDWAALLEKQLREKTLTPDFRFPSTDARLSMARLCALQERFDEAEDWLGEAREILEDQGARPLRAIVDLDDARMRLLRGAPGDAETAAQALGEALRAFRAIGMPGWAARARSLASEHHLSL